MCGSYIPNGYRGVGSRWLSAEPWRLAAPLTSVSKDRDEVLPRRNRARLQWRATAPVTTHAGDDSHGTWLGDASRRARTHRAGDPRHRSLGDHMTNPAMAEPCETSAPNRLKPPPVRLPKLVQGVGFAVFRRKAMQSWIKRHGRIFQINVPFFGRCVVVSDPALVRSVYTANAEQLINVQPNLSNWFGPGSVFGFDGSRR